MKIHIEFPNGGQLDIEREPMSSERFQAICSLVYAMIAAATFLGIFLIFNAAAK